VSGRRTGGFVIVFAGRGAVSGNFFGLFLLPGKGICGLIVQEFRTLK
jgi:hypothetical protein